MDYTVADTAGSDAPPRSETGLRSSVPAGYPISQSGRSAVVTTALGPCTPNARRGRRIHPQQLVQEKVRMTIAAPHSP